MDSVRTARAVGGLLAIVTLLGLVAADVLSPAVTLDPPELAVLLGVISALLGIDIVSERLPVTLTVGERGGDGEGSDP